ncbi:MAG: hypothetical protein HGA61_04795 [Candidatus Moranbacteria bacterium]|nr:hypothetical protein [Candidatus Moranbacteria bacterium]
MPHIPENVKNLTLVESLMPYLVSQGKVGDKYDYPDNERLFLASRSDRISSDDFNLPLFAAAKGQVLTAFADYWDRMLFKPLGITNHLAHSDVYPGRNKAKELCEKFPGIDLRRMLAVIKVKVLGYELIFRFHLGGSVWKQYLENNGVVAGVQLPLRMKKWQKLEKPLFTPSTKAAEGHDINITQEEFFQATGEIGRRLIEKLLVLCTEVYNHLEKRNIIMLDTKLESDGKIICDEWFNPDTSRFVSEANLAESIAKGVEPEFMDKQPVRDFCAKIVTPFYNEEGKQIIGLKGLDPKNPAHCRFVAEYDFPPSIAEELTRRFLKIFEMITGENLVKYQAKYLL